MSSAELKNNDWWERYFAVGGDWERRGGRRQTRVFAEHFIRHAGLPADQAFSLLDAGCALGDALALFAASYPKARLHGMKPPTGSQCNSSSSSNTSQCSQ